MERFDVQVRGAGIVGMCLALSLARIGLRVALQPQPPRPATGPDVRAYALNARSVALLREIKVWDALPPGTATAVHEMRIEGDARGAALGFSAWQQRVGELAWIVDAAVLERELGSALRFSPHIRLGAAERAAEVDAPLLALCEGQDSASRDELGVVFERHDYGQRAIAARLGSSRPHQGVARQWFRSPDVLALLPMDLAGRVPADHSFALVWSMPQGHAEQLLAVDPVAFEQQLAEATGHAAGQLSLLSARASWPLGHARAERWSGPGWVLLGDAAHVVHPLAGQGLNLGLADAAVLARVVAEREPWRSLGDPRLLRRYARARQAPTWVMGQLTDGLLQLFANPAPALRELRNRGMTLVDHSSFLKRWLAERALDS